MHQKNANMETDLNLLHCNFVIFFSTIEQFIFILFLRLHAHNTSYVDVVYSD